MTYTSNVKRIDFWKPLKFYHQSLQLKPKTLSIGGRLTFIKLVLESFGIYYMPDILILEDIFKINGIFLGVFLGVMMWEKES